MPDRKWFQGSFAGRSSTRSSLRTIASSSSATTVGGKKLAVETSVGRMLLKSAPGRVTRQGGQYRIFGAAWGGDVAKVEVQIDDGPWQAASIDRSEASEFAWKPWFLDWPTPSPGEHAITSRATDAAGRVQPAMDDPVIANKRTYWESNGQVTRRVRVA